MSLMTPSLQSLGSATRTAAHSVLQALLCQSTVQEQPSSSFRLLWGVACSWGRHTSARHHAPITTCAHHTPDISSSSNIPTATQAVSAPPQSLVVPCGVAALNTSGAAPCGTWEKGTAQLGAAVSFHSAKQYGRRLIASRLNQSAYRFAEGYAAIIPSVAQLGLLRCSSSSSSNAAGASSQEGVYVVPFPKLSHTMETGWLAKWYKQPGDRVNMYDILYELDTEEIAEPEYRIGDFAGRVTMLIEAQEEGWLGARLVQEGGEPLAVGTPVAVVCEEEEQATAMRKGTQPYACPTTNVYDDAQPQVQVLTWQSYLKQGKRQVKCMG